MIEGFRHKGLRKLYESGNHSGISGNMVARVEEVLSVLDAAETIEEINLPGYRLHALSGDLEGFWSVRINGNWRIIFRFEGGTVCDVDLVDYH